MGNSMEEVNARIQSSDNIMRIINNHKGADEQVIFRSIQTDFSNERFIYLCFYVTSPNYTKGMKRYYRFVFDSMFITTHYMDSNATSIDAEYSTETLKQTFRNYLEHLLKHA